jgi:hypothetical protein
VARDPFIAGFLDHAEKVGGYKTIWDLGMEDLP